MTREDAIKQARLDGLRDDQLTDEVLKLYGYEVKNPVEGVPTQPLMMDAETQNALKLLDEEAKKNQDIAGPIIGAIGKVVGFARSTGLIKWCLVSVLLLGATSCGESTQARATAQAVDANLTSYTAKRDAYDEKLIAYFRTSEHERIELIFQNALASLSSPRAVAVKKLVREQIVGADGQPAFREKEVEEIIQTKVVEENAVIALTKQKLRLIQMTEVTVLEMRNMLKMIEKDAQNAKTLLAGLDAYFNQRVSTLEAVEQAQTGLISFLGMFLKDKKEKAEPGVEALPTLLR